MEILEPLVASLWAAAKPNLWWLLPLIAASIVLAFPMAGRGPHSSHRDPWRGFKYPARAEV